MARARLWPLALVALVALVSGCSEREVNPFDANQDHTAPVVTSFVYSDGAVWWSTDEDALCVVEYGAPGGEYDHYAYEATKQFREDHALSLLGMQDGQQYQIRVRSLDRAGNEGYSASVALPDTVVGASFDGQTMTLSMIDVGWGLSMVLTTPDGSNTLIDAATVDHYPDVLDFLDEHGISILDAAVATHYHGDHVGGYEVDGGVLDRYSIGEFVSPDTTTLYIQMLPAIRQKLELYDIPVTYVKAGDTSENRPELDWDSTPGFKVEVLSAGLGGQIGGPEDTTDEGMKGNNDSIVMRFSWDGVRFVVTGDAEFFTEYRIVSTYGRDAVRSDLLQVAHHGNDDATSQLWLDNLSPRVALISDAIVEAALEKEVVLNGILNVNADYFATDRVFPNTPRDASPAYGNLIAVTDGHGIEIILERHDW
jgi:beta-lactamase superfamily II metal-dependent hydrolase